MKRIPYYLLAAMILSISLPIFSQDKEEEDDEEDRPSRSYMSRTKIGGAGGITPIVGMFDNKELDKFLTSAGMPTLGTDPTYLFGGEGYGYVMFLKNVRIGGFGLGGKRTVSAIQAIPSGGSLKKEVDYEISYGGILFDYVQPIAYRLDVAIGGSIGGGEMNLTMRRDDGSFKDWSTLWNDFGNPATQSTNYTRRVKGSFVAFNPRINIEYTLLTWLQIRIGAAYPITFSQEWKLDDKYEVNAVPAKLKLEGYTVNAGLMFGFFGW